MAAPAVPAAALALLLLQLLTGCLPASSSTPSPPTTPAPSPEPTPSLSVAVNPKKMSALVSDRFLSLSIDPTELAEHRRLGPGSVRSFAMARGMSPAYLRLAGPSSDHLRFSREDSASHNGTATEGDLVAVGRWARDAGWTLVIGLDALSRDAKQGGAWDQQHAAEMLGQADRHGFELALQLGYESSGLARAGVSGAALGADLSLLRALLSDFPRYKSAALLGPDIAAAMGAPRANRDAVHYLQDEARAAAPEPDVIVWQPWSSAVLSEGRDPVNEPDLEREDVNRLLGRAAARRPLWIAESDDASPRSFGGALQWARRVQVAERAGADVIFRRWHSPGDDHQPTPDFWVSLLHKRLCGRAVLDTRLAGNRSAASVTARCTAAPPPARGPARPNARFTGSFTKLSYERGDVTMFAVNSGPVEAKVAVKFSPAAGLHQTVLHEYILTACDGDLDKRCALLNGQELGVNSGGGLPGLTPRVRQSGADRETTLTLPAHSVAFFVFPGAQSRACQTAPPGAAEAEAAKVPLQLSPRRTQDVQVQFHVDGLSKSKAKDKLAATLKDEDRRQNALLDGDAQPLPWSAPSSLEQYADMDEPRPKRATAVPHHPPRPSPLAAPEDWHDRLPKAPVLKRKHALPLATAPALAAKVPDELPEDSPSTIPVASWYRPDDDNDDKKPAPLHKHHRLPPKPLLKLPKRMPLPAAPRLPKRPPAHPHPHPHAPSLQQRHKALPKGLAVASLVDPEKGVSAEDEPEEVEHVTADPFPTGDVVAEVGESDEEKDDLSGGREEEHGDYEYVVDDEGDEEVQEGQTQKDQQQLDKPSAPQPEASQFDNKDVNEHTPYYFAPGEFMQQYNTVPRTPPSSSAGEIGEMDMAVEPISVVQPTTPPPYEPHLEEFVVVQQPALTAEQQQLARQRADSFYQGVAEQQPAAPSAPAPQQQYPYQHNHQYEHHQEQQHAAPSAPEQQQQYPYQKNHQYEQPQEEHEAHLDIYYPGDTARHELAPEASVADVDQNQEIDTDLLIELGKRYLREKKMTLKHNELDPLDCEKSDGIGPSAPMAEEVDLAPMGQHVRHRRQLRVGLPTGASIRPFPRSGASEEAGARRQMPAELREELEQRVRERRERLEKAREATREQLPDREERLSRVREQLEKAREQQPDREERLSRAREQLEKARESAREQLEKAREQQQQPDREERLSRAREQLEKAREELEQLREQRERLREDRVRPGAASVPRPAPRRRSERVKRSEEASGVYLDSFGRHEFEHPTGGWRRGTPAPPLHHPHPHVHADGGVVRRYKYGYAPAQQRVGVRHEVVRKTDVRRYKQPAGEEAVSVEQVEQAASRNQLMPRRQQGLVVSGRRQQYQPHDNVAVLWKGSPLSPLQTQHRPRVNVEVPVEVNVVPKPVFTAPEENEDSELTAQTDDQDEDETPTEVKTTQILKTERTYATTEASESDSSAEESGYSSGEVVDSEQTGPQYIPLDIPSRGHSHHHHQHHHHQHSQYEEEEAVPCKTSEESTLSSSEESEDAAQQSLLLPPEAEGEAGPMPVFPFREPSGPKHKVVGFRADESSPGGWYTFATTSHYSPPEEVSSRSATASYAASANYPTMEVHTTKKYSRVSSRPQTSAQQTPRQQAYQAPRLQAPQPQAPRPQASILRQTKQNSYGSLSANQHRVHRVSAPKPTYNFVASQPEPVRTYASPAVRVVSPSTPPPAPAAAEQYEESQEQPDDEQPQEQQEQQLEEQPEEQSEEQPRQQQEQTEDQPEMKPAEQPQEKPQEQTTEQPQEQPEEQPEDSYVSFVPAAPVVARAPIVLQPAPKPAPQPAPQPAPRPATQQALTLLSQPAQPAPQRVLQLDQPAPQRVLQPALPPAARPAAQLVRRPTATRKAATQQTNAPLALSYLAKYFRPVQEQAPKFQQVSYSRGRAASSQSSAWQQSARPPPAAINQWDQPAAAPAVGLWGQPAAAAPTDELWSQPAARQRQAAPVDNLWGQPAAAPADDLWGQPAPAATDNLWGQPAAESTDNLWGKPAASAASVDNLWGKPAAAPAANQWDQPAPSAPAARLWRPASTGRGAHVASLEQPAGEQLLDYNTHILLRRPGSDAPQAAAVQVASLAPAGGEVVVPVRRRVPAASAPAPSPPLFGLPDSGHPRARRALRDFAPGVGAGHHRGRRGFFDGLADLKKVMQASNLLVQDGPAATAAPASDKGADSGAGSSSLVEEVGGSKPVSDLEAQALIDKLASFRSSSTDGNKAVSVLDLLPWRLYVRGGGDAASPT